MKNNSIEKKIQKYLNKFISEEKIASDMYIGAVNACCCEEQRQIIKEEFEKVAEDELNDHAKHLIEWALNNGYTVPYRYSDFEKYAGENTVKQYKNLKSEQKAIYYIDEAIKSERDAIQSYEEVLVDKDIPSELDGIILRNYYDEVEHLQKFSLMKIANDASCVVSFG